MLVYSAVRPGAAAVEGFPNLLIDSTHKKWILFTIVAGAAVIGLYVALDRLTPDGLTGGSTVGLWYGVVGSALMIFAGLLAAHRKAPGWSWIGARKAWLKGHIWLGLLSGVLILCHSGFSWGGPLTQALWIVLGLTLVTGVMGLVLQQFLPRLMTTRIPAEAPYEQIPHLCRVMRRKADALVESLAGSLQSKAAAGPAATATIMGTIAGLGAQNQLQEFYEMHVRPFLGEAPPRSSPLANPMQAQALFAKLRTVPGLAGVEEQLQELAVLCDQRRQLAEQERLHRWLHGWLYVHVPMSVALLALGAAHVVMALYY